MGDENDKAAAAGALAWRNRVCIKDGRWRQHQANYLALGENNGEINNGCAVCNVNRNDDWRRAGDYVSPVMRESLFTVAAV